MGVTEVAEQLGTSKAYAYRVIRKLNAELVKEGRLVIQGKVSRVYIESDSSPEAHESHEARW